MLSEVFKSFTPQYEVNNYFIDNTIPLGDNLTSDIFSTSSKSTELQNREYLKSLRENKEVFLSSLYHSDFEDGETNQAIEYVKEKLSENSFATAIWLSELFSHYRIDSSNPESSSFVAYGIMRTLSSLKNEDCFSYIRGPLIMLLESALSTKVPYIQEAAIMVIEKWRDKELISILNAATFSDKGLTTYKNSVVSELESEESTIEVI